MDPQVKREYARLRAKGWTAKDAMRSARIKARFDELEAEGICELKAEPEIEYYDDSYLDTWDLSPKKLAAEKKALAERINREGHWILCAVYRGEIIDSVGGFIGDDYLDSGYDTDLMRSCIDAYEKETSTDANALAGRATYAGVTP